jgi:hypothetical protein
MVTLKANRPMLIAGSAVCSVVVVGSLPCLLAPFSAGNTRIQGCGFPLVLLFDLVFAYRLYRYVKLIPAKKISN